MQGKRIYLSKKVAAGFIPARLWLGEHSECGRRSERARGREHNAKCRLRDEEGSDLGVQVGYGFFIYFCESGFDSAAVRQTQTPSSSRGAPRRSAV